MDRHPLPDTTADQMQKGPHRYSPQPSTSATAMMQVITDEDEPGPKRKKRGNKKIDHESILAAHREANFHDSRRDESGRRLAKSKVDEIEANKNTWREQNGPWDFSKDWGEKKDINSFSNLIIIKRGDDEIRAQPRIAFKWFLAIQSEKLDQEVIKSEWIKLSRTTNDEKLFDKIVWSENRKCYCETRKFKQTFMNRGEVQRENLDSLLSQVGGIFRKSAMREKVKAAQQTPTLTPHGLTDEEMDEKYILKLDEYGCVPLDGDWYWGLWSSPKTAEDKMKLSIHEKAGRFYCQRICIPVEYKGHKYMVGLEYAFKLWLGKQTEQIIPREKLDEEFERIKGLESRSLENIEWGVRMDGRYGYGVKKHKYSRLVAFYDTDAIKTHLVPTSSSDPPHGMVDGTLRLKPLAPAERMADIIEEPFKFEGAKRAMTAIMMNMKEKNVRIDEKDVNHVINKTSSSAKIKNLSDKIIHYDNKYVRALGNNINILRPIPPIRYNKKVIQEKSSTRHVHWYRVYLLLLLNRSKTANKTKQEIFQMLMASGIQREDKVYVGKHTREGLAAPQDYHKERPEISSVGELLLTGEYDAFEIAVISCTSREEQEKLEAFIYFILVKLHSLGQLSLINKMGVVASLSMDDIIGVFRLAEKGETRLIHFTEEVRDNNKDIFKLNYHCSRLDFHDYQRGSPHGDNV